MWHFLKTICEMLSAPYLLVVFRLEQQIHRQLPIATFYQFTQLALVFADPSAPPDKFIFKTLECCMRT